MGRTILSDYLNEIARIRGTGAGTKEISSYGALTGALNAVGHTLRPRVFCVPNLRNRGAGFPDMGLFVAARGLDLADWPEGRPPDRGVVEVDDIPAPIATKRDSAQVKRYLAEYGLVLVTNYRDFVLLGRGANGAEERERFSFDCADADGFFALARSTRRPAGLATRFADFLQRVLLHQAALARPEDVAFFLASYARDALARVEERAELPAFQALRGALQEALGLTFEDARGEHLFRSTLVQTLFYGLFSAWVETAREGRPFHWHAAGWDLHVPFISTLFQQIATRDKLKPLGLEEPMQWASDALNRVDRGAFFKAFSDADAVRYFYEPFLQAFDPELRRQLGVWYTPREIVRYMVERVDRVLREELGVADGLADPSVWVLDPCCGTGAYLVEVLERIRRTLTAKGEDALIAEDLKQAARTRIAGFEIMPAPYVIAHWQVGHLLREAGAALGESERAAVYLTNALTGWAEAEKETAENGQAGLKLVFPPLAEERDEARRVKRERPILVILGNPPYNAFAGTSPTEEGGLVAPYKEGLQKVWGIRKFNLDDLYVRFFRVAERRIADGTGRGVVCFISNYSWLTGSSFVVMRQRLLREFDRVWIDNMHGDRKISEYGPDGRTSETVFAIKGFSPGIRQGTAVSLWVRRAQRAERPIVRFNDSFDASKADDRRAQMLASFERADFDALYTEATPTAENRFAFRPGEVAGAYASWPRMIELAAVPPFNGLMEKRGGALIDNDRGALAARMRAYFDQKRSWNDVAPLIGGLAKKAGRYDPKSTRAKLIARRGFADGSIYRYHLRPFDLRYAYAVADRPLWNEPRPKLLRQLPTAGGFLATRPAGVANPEGIPLTWTTALGDNDALRGHAYYTPPVVAGGDAVRANLSPSARAWLAALGLPDPDSDRDTVVLPWLHALAIGYSPAWLAENEHGIRGDWPRIPLPGSADLLRASAALGRRVADLLDPDTPVPGVTEGTVEPALRALAVPTKQGGGNMAEADRALTAGWGHAGKGGAVMPGRGRTVSRGYAADEADTAAHAALLGARTLDVFLNDSACWRNIPEHVWSFTIGGYQVLKKWLSYREKPLLGRALTPAEVRYVRDTARRLAALRLMGPALDANYRACADAHRPL
ncbi:type ISP restriction/modification enzyme [Elioraea sp.]|uniref:type ISP restriction/modification enzyme n=1 Tax=Elioraea sp. TaxID=2185103 RepID=UPI003F7159EC